MPKYKKLNTKDFINFNDRQKSYTDGVFTLQLNSWNDFHNVVRIFNDNTDYFWRGQRKDWQLKSSFDRDPVCQKFSAFLGRRKALEVLLEQFKKRLDDLPNKPRNINDDKAWAIGQHYGLSTPLLDWTAVPYKSAYFAFYEKEADQKERYIYVLHRTVHRLKQIKKNPKTKQKLDSCSFIEFLDLTATQDKSLDERINAQNAKFTKSLNGINIESNVLHFALKQPSTDEKKEILFMKISIPETFRDEYLRSLKSMKITHGVLFPDIAGAVEITKKDLGLE